jgi:hypothetical protein
MTCFDRAISTSSPSAVPPSNLATRTHIGFTSSGRRGEPTRATPEHSFDRKYDVDDPFDQPGPATLPGIEDYTNKYKGEQVEVALFGGEYQEGVLTAYCYVEDVAHIELNGHILVPLQNIASLHCSSRCDAPEDDWPPRGLEQEDGN